jgi:hypothetical protein
MLALAKLGEPAIPAIRDRAMAILRTGDSGGIHAADPLIEVLGSMGPSAIPSLVQIAEASKTSSVALSALDEIVRLEPRSNVFGQDLSGWLFWRPADDRLTQMARELVPLLPRIRQLMERAIPLWKPQSPPPQRSAAYLLARWGTGENRARGLQVLDDLARNEPFYDALASIRLLHALKAPQTAALIRTTVEKVPTSDGLKGGFLLGMAIALRQLGDSNYATLLDIPLRDGRPDVRMDAMRFIASTGDLSNVALLLPLLNDRTDSNGRSVAEVAHESLLRLTMEQQLPPDASGWRGWLERTKTASRANVVAQAVEARTAAISNVPIWEANRWIKEFAAGDGATVFPLIDAYLRRPDLVASAVGPNRGIGSGGTGPVGLYGPRIVTLLLEMTQQGLPGASERLVTCLEAADPSIRVFGSLALAAYDRPRALDRLAQDADASEGGSPDLASEFLLQLGDKRGIPARLATLNHDYEALRLYACRDLRMYSQQPLPCDARATPLERAVQVAAWNAWWIASERTFTVKTHEAILDLHASPLISPVSFGGRVVQ